MVTLDDLIPICGQVKTFGASGEKYFVLQPLSQ